PAPLPAAPPPSGLTLRLIAPDGEVFEARPEENGTILVADVASRGGLPPGDWTAEVGGTAFAQPYTGIAVVAMPAYALGAPGGNDIGRLRERQDTGFDGLLRRLLDLEPRTADVTVAFVTDGGRGGLFDLGSSIFVPLQDAQALLAREGEVNVVLLSNPGDARQGAAGTAAANATLAASLERLRSQHSGAVYTALEVRGLKQEFLDVADDAGKLLTNLLLFAGSLSVVTGLLLIVNLFTMLAEERRSELGMARAVGLGRRDLVRLFTYEGALYAVAAAAAGAILGVLLAFGLVQLLNVLVSRLAEDRAFPPIPFEPRLRHVLIAFATGALLTFATMLAASRRTARLNIVRAIRRIPEPESKRLAPRDVLLGFLLLAAGLAASAAGWSAPLREAAGLGGFPLSLRVFGPLAVAVGLALLLHATLTRRRLYVLLAAALGLVYLASLFATERGEQGTEANIVGPLRGVLLTFCLVVLAVHWDWAARQAGALLARVRAVRPIARAAVAYPLHRKLRTGMTLAMFSVVLLSIGFFSIFGALFQVDPARQTGGFEVAGRTTLDVGSLDMHDAGLLPPGLVRQRLRLADFETERPGFLTVQGGRTGNYGDVTHHVYGFEEAFADRGGFRLMLKDGAYATDADAYRAVLEEPGLVIVSYTYSTNARNEDLAFGVGDTLEMHLGDAVRPYRIVGVQEQYYYGGIFLPRGEVVSLFPDTRDLYLFDLAPGADAAEAALLLERNHRSAGLDAEDTEAEVLERQKSFRQVMGAMKLYLGLGLIVGVLSLGIVTSRNVLERRQEIGMLRALGCSRAAIRALFFIEVTVTILAGAVVGLVCAVLVTFALWYSVIRGLGYPYTVPWAEILLLVAASYVVALLAALAPIGRSAKVAPAEALRYLE
ncbi:MAG TPA: FtsX-like permease family protein, partial [Candidatus Thermoplasmatota archaeon]|nr:FtsX-like permease family protein [Candidatus Thermoplasmatota archaeon]